MRSTQSLNITLPQDIAEMVKAKVASGEYASESDVVRDGLLSLAARDADVETWLRNKVLPTLQSIKNDPMQLLDADEAWAQLRAHMNR